MVGNGMIVWLGASLLVSDGTAMMVKSSEISDLRWDCISRRRSIQYGRPPYYLDD